jgi:ketosteroid isomerase-like protein
MNDLATLALRVEELLAREAIRELRARYSNHARQGDWRGITDLFTEDGVFDSVRPNGEHLLWQGREKIYANLIERNVSVLPLISNEIVHIDGDTAVGSCTMMTTKSPDPNSNGFTGNYYEEMRRENGSWLFSLRRFEVVSGSF